MWMNELQGIFHADVFIWMLPIIFFIHDSEEIFTAEKWAHKHPAELRKILGERLIDMRKNITIQYMAAVLLLGFVITLATYAAFLDYLEIGKVNTLYAGILAVLFLDGIKHVGASIIFRKYTPGVITAALVEIPFTSFALYYFHHAEMLNVRMIATGFLIALPLIVTLTAAFLLLGKRLAPFRPPHRIS